MAIKTDIEEQISRNAVFEGRLVIHQPKKGYRFSVDALLLIYYACQGRRVLRAADLGAGSGIVGLGLLADERAEQVIGVELQANLAKLAKENSRLNGVEAKYKIVNSDIRNLKQSDLGGGFDLITANPPFWPVFKERMPQDEERRLACHEVSCGLEQWTETGARLINQKSGRFVVVFPARRLDSLIVALESSRLSTTRLRMVHPRADREAELVLVEAKAGPLGRMVVETPLVLKDDAGRDTMEAASVLSGSFSNKINKLPDLR